MARPRGSKKQQEREARLQLGRGKLVGYIRVSTEGQANEGHSLGGQADRLREAAGRWGFTITAVYSDVASGGRVDRDGLTEAVTAVENGEAEGVLFAKFDRVTRSMKHGAELVSWARSGGYSLVSADEGIMVAEGELKNEALPFFLALAQVEKERISRRTKEGLAAARAKGVQLGAVIRTQADDPAAVRAIELRQQGLTYAQVAEKLNEEGHRTARGSAWASGNTYTMIRRVCPELVG